MAWIIILPDFLFYLVVALFGIWGATTLTLFYMMYRYMVNLYNRVDARLAQDEQEHGQPKEQIVEEMDSTNPFANLVLLDSDHLGY